MARAFELEQHAIRVTSRGEWLHGSQPLHPRVESLFRRNVEPDDDGRYFVVLGFRRHILEVEDTPFFVRSISIERDDDGRIVTVEILTSDGKTERLDPSTLMQSSDNVLYCRVRRSNMWVPCRFQPAQYHDLALNAELHNDEATIQIGSNAWGIHPYDPKPKRVS